MSLSGIYFTASMKPNPFASQRRRMNVSMILREMQSPRQDHTASWPYEVTEALHNDATQCHTIEPSRRRILHTVRLDTIMMYVI